MALETSIPARIVDLIQSGDWPVGSHLPAQKLADSKIRGLLKA